MFEPLTLADGDEITVDCSHTRFFQGQRTLEFYLHRCTRFHANFLAAREQNLNPTVRGKLPLRPETHMPMPAF